MSFFDETAARRYLGNGRRIDLFDEITSTNDVLYSRVQSGEAKQGDVIAAAAQSAGRGRRGKSFSSARGGIYFSFCANNTTEVVSTVTAGIAVAGALESFGYSPSIKWVNDVLLGGKKVCGILAQACPGTDLCVIGIGINLKESSLPPELHEIATSLESESGELPGAGELVGRIIYNFESLETAPRAEVINAYRGYLHFLGGNVVVTATGEVCRAIDINEKCELTVERPNGEKMTLGSGEISIRPL